MHKLNVLSMYVELESIYEYFVESSSCLTLPKQTFVARKKMATRWPLEPRQQCRGSTLLNTLGLGTTVKPDESAHGATGTNIRHWLKHVVCVSSD